MALFIYVTPFLLAIKHAIRSLNNAYLKNEYLDYGGLYSAIKSVNWWEAVINSSEGMLMRMQHLDVVIVLMNNANLLAEKLRNREFLYFFEEGLPQFTIERLLGWPRVQDLHIKAIHFFRPEYAHVTNYQGMGIISNTHTGLVSWLWIAPELAPLFLAYLLILTWSGMWLAKKLDASGKVIQLVWFAVLFWVMNGWFGAYIEFIQALVVVILARLLVGKLNVKL